MRLGDGVQKMRLRSGRGEVRKAVSHPRERGVATGALGRLRMVLNRRVAHSLWLLRGG